MSPCLKLLTDDAIFAQRPLPEVIQEYHCYSLFQFKENEGRVLVQMKLTFEDAPQTDVFLCVQCENPCELCG